MKGPSPALTLGDRQRGTHTFTRSLSALQRATDKAARISHTYRPHHRSLPLCAPLLSLALARSLSLCLVVCVSLAQSPTRATRTAHTTSSFANTHPPQQTMCVGQIYSATAAAARLSPKTIPCAQKKTTYSSAQQQQHLSSRYHPRMKDPPHKRTLIPPPTSRPRGGPAASSPFCRSGRGGRPPGWRARRSSGPSAASGSRA